MLSAVPIDAPFLIAGLAFTLAVIITPLVRRIALATNLVDAPDGHRKLHGRIVALGGGVAVFASMGLALVICGIAGSQWINLGNADRAFLTAIAGSSLFLVVVGLLDDKFEIRGRQKFLAQIAAVFCVSVLGGLRIDRIEMFGFHIDMGVAAVPFTMFWLLGAINALNLIDGVDGLATTIGVVFSVALSIMATMNNFPVDGVCALAMAGSLAGFLIYNLPPAKIFLGDAGSMLIGLVLGVLAIRCSLKGPATVALAAPTAIWAVLIFDVGMAILRRKLTGRSLYTTDRGHLHHALQKHGFSGLGIVFVVGLMCVICSIGALVSVYSKNEGIAVLTAGIVLGALVATRYFGHSECRLLAQKVLGVTSSFVRLPNRPKKAPAPFKSRFHGKREWDLLWESLLEMAEKFDLSSVRLNVSAPSIGEEYHATWERKHPPHASRIWSTEVPLFAGVISVGRLSVAGAASDESGFGYLTDFLDALRPFEVQLHDLLQIEHVDSQKSSGEIPIPQSLTDSAEMAATV
jgi:UDP-GlcNAc:undecaprenyl-phosphate/decaprenyl-phosphate GlcNAc-1-phosphate transferase